MKKGVILLFLFILVTPFLVDAAITLNDASQKYNLGDIAKIEGYITSNGDVRSVLRVYMDCQNSLQLSAKMVNVKANERYSFSQDINLFGEQGICRFRATFNGESKSSNNFEITNELKGAVFVNENDFILGNLFELSGDVFTINSNKFSGLGIISLNKDDSAYLVDTFDIIEGELSYNSILENLPPETYSGKLEVFDFYGNGKIFDLGSIIISDDLPADTNLDKISYLPEDSIIVSGNVDSDDYKITFEFEDSKFEESFDKSDFSYLLSTKNDIKSGKHIVKVKIIDKYGNYYEEDLSFEITGIPKRLEVKINEKVNYLPEDTVEIFSAVYDQGNDIYGDLIELIVTDQNKDAFLETTINSGTIYGLNLEKYTAPGSYIVTAESSDFKVENEFIVDEFSEINSYYDQNRLKISNEGNIDINEDFTITLDGQTYSFSINLRPSEIESYDLRDKVSKDDYYDIKVNFRGKIIDVNQAYISDDRSNFEKITGGVIGGGGTTSWVTYLLILIVIVLLLYMFFFRKPDDSYQRDLGYKEAQQKLKKIREERAGRKPKGRFFDAKDIDKEEAKQFRESMVGKTR